MSQWMRQTVMQRVALFGLAMLLVSSAALTALYVWHELGRVKEVGAQQLRQAVLLQRQLLQGWQEDKQQLAAQLAASEAAQLQALPQLRQQLQQVLRSTREVMAVVYVGQDGWTLLDSDGSPSFYVGDREYFRQALQGQAFVSELLTGRLTGKKFMAFSQPVWSHDGYFRGAVVVLVDTGRLVALLEESRPFLNGRICLVAPDNTVLAAEEEGVLPEQLAETLQELSATAGGTLSYSRDGAEHLAAYQTLPAGRWVIWGEIPLRQLLLPFWAFLERALVLMVLVVVLASPLIWLLGHSLQRPIRALAQGARRVETGDYSGRIDPVEARQAPVELQALCDAFNLMSGVLQENVGMLQEFHHLATEAEGLLQKYRLLSENATDIILFLRQDEGLIIEANHAAELAYGQERQELIGRPLAGLYPPGQADAAWEHLRTAPGGKVLECQHRRSDGRLFDVEVSVQQLESEGQRVVAFLIRDVSERKAFEQKLRRMSLHDQLTGLYNRFFFEHERARLEEEGQGPLGVLVCDVDGLKLINDTLGHQAGDELIRGAADVLRRSLRGQDVVCRVGGDEFVVLLPATAAAGVQAAQRRLLQTLREHNERRPMLPLFMSCGWAVALEAPLQTEALLREADHAMYEEKNRLRAEKRRSMLRVLEQALHARDGVAKDHGDAVAAGLARLAAASGLAVEGEVLRRLGRYHDLGKVAVAEELLNKAEPLDEAEWQELRKHADVGGRIAQLLPDLADLAAAIRHHHECWDGSGYPDGLAGEAIPLLSRMVAIADAFDAMQRTTVYHVGKSRREARRELERCAGKQLDPVLTALFLQEEGEG